MNREKFARLTRTYLREVLDRIADHPSTASPSCCPGTSTLHRRFAPQPDQRLPVKQKRSRRKTFTFQEQIARYLLDLDLPRLPQLWLRLREQVEDGQLVLPS
jgi:hypothetical protein